MIIACMLHCCRVFRIHSFAVNHIGFATHVKLYICPKADKL